MQVVASYGRRYGSNQDLHNRNPLSLQYKPVDDFPRWNTSVTKLSFTCIDPGHPRVIVDRAWMNTSRESCLSRFMLALRNVISPDFKIYNSKSTSVNKIMHSAKFCNASNARHLPRDAG